MKPIPNLGLMLDKYNPLHLEEIRNKLLKYANGPVTKENVFDEIARINGEMAGLPANNTARDRIKLFSDNPILNYHWTQNKKFQDFILRGDRLPWDSLGVHSGTPKAANDRMLQWLEIDKLDDVAEGELNTLGRIIPIIIDGDRPFKLGGDIRSELDKLGNPRIPGLQSELNGKYSKFIADKLGLPSAYDEYGPIMPRNPDDHDKALKYVRDSIFKDNLHTTIPYINESEDIGSISHITPPTNLKSAHARFDPRQFRNGVLMDAVLAAPMPAMLDPVITKKNNETARQAFDFATSFVPVLGPARDAVRDFNKGDYGWAAANAAMAAAEMGIPLLAGVKVLKPALMKGLSYLK